MTTHTPGPWTIQSARNAYDIYSDNPERVVGRAYLMKDARLFAAAPELLAALVLAEKQLRSWHISTKPASRIDVRVQEALDTARAAIAKATEKTS